MLHTVESNELRGYGPQVYKFTGNIDTVLAFDTSLDFDNLCLQCRPKGLIHLNLHTGSLVLSFIGLLKLDFLFDFSNFR